MTNIKVFCPECGDEMIEEKYETSLQILKERVWYVCKTCRSSVDRNTFWSRLNKV